MGAREITIRSLVIPAIRCEVESLTEGPRPSFVKAAVAVAFGLDPVEQGTRDLLSQAMTDWADPIAVLGCEPISDDLLARVAIDALAPETACLFIHSDEPAHFDVLASLLELDCSPEVRADLLDCIEAVLDKMDHADAILDVLASCQWSPIGIGALAWAA